jgi:inner membrane transporter RhtA
MLLSLPSRRLVLATPSRPAGDVAIPARSARARADLRGPLSVVAASASLHTAAALAVTSFAVFGTLGTASLRFAVGALVLLAVVRPRLCGRSARTWAAIVAMGVSSALASLALYAAIDRIPLGTAATVQFLGPLTVALLGARRRTDVACAAGAAAGVVLLTGPSGVDPVGVAFALAAAALAAAGIFAIADVGGRTDGFDGLALALGVAAVCLLPFGVPAALGAPSAGDLAVLVAVGVLGSVVPYALFFDAVRRVGKRVYGILLSLDPAVAAFAGVLWLGQGLGAPDVAGVALVCAASAIAVGTRRDAG